MNMYRHNVLKRIRLLSLLICLLVAGYSATAQSEWGAEVSLLKPTGRFGHLFKASPGLRVTRSFSDTRSKFYKRAFVGIHNFSPRRDTVNIGYYTGSDPLSNSGRDVIVGGYQVQELNLYLTLGAQGQWRPIQDAALRPVGIIELHGMIGQVERTSVTATEILGESLGDVGVGVATGAGLEYLTDGTFTFYLNITKTYNYTNEQGVFAYWNTAMGATVLF